jgi:uncharacterized protein YjbI with pentapeptide repeats
MCHISREILNENGVWACPHEAEDGAEFCIFHLPMAEKDTEEVVSRFLDLVTKNTDSVNTRATANHYRFIGSKFGSFDLNSRAVDILSSSTIDLSYSTIDGVLDWSNLTIDVDELIFTHASFNAPVYFEDSEICGTMYSAGVDFETKCSFEETEFTGPGFFSDARFSADANFTATTFNEQCSFDAATFLESANFSQAEFERNANFSSVSIGDRAEFWNAEFADSIDLGVIEIDGTAHFRAVTFGGDMECSGARFEGNAAFRGASFTDRITFRNTEFLNGVSFIDNNLDGAEFQGANLTDANLTGAKCCNANFESSLLSRATLFNTDLRGARLSGAVLGDIRIDNQTTFLGMPSDNPDRSLSSKLAGRNNPYCVYDPAYEGEDPDEDVQKAKGVYRALEEIAAAAARTRLQTQCFVRRQHLQKRSYFVNARDRKLPFSHRLSATLRWSRAKAAELVLLYGESPWRVIGYSASVIVGFGLLFPVGGWIQTTAPNGSSAVTYSRIMHDPVLLWKSIYHSAMLFATGNSYGGVVTSGTIGEVLTTVEALLGPTLLALLVFVLGRRAAR